MMKLALVLLMGLNFIVTPIATVDRIEGNHAIIEVGTQMVIVPTEDFNNPISEGNKLAIDIVVGAFDKPYTDIDGYVYYQFKSYDDAVWWTLTAEDIGFAPQANKTYALTYYNNGTTDCTECAEEFECECEVYDDIFLTIVEGGI